MLATFDLRVQLAGTRVNRHNYIKFDDYTTPALPKYGWNLAHCKDR